MHQQSNNQQHIRITKTPVNGRLNIKNDCRELTASEQIEWKYCNKRKKVVPNTKN
jgi:hypothetical protein